jgi:bla regulator protein blaR1
LKKDPDMIYVESRTVDKTDYPFVNDPEVIGRWESVDFVSEIEEFKADEKQWIGGDLFLKEMIFEDNGRATLKNDKVPQGYSRTWTKGLVLNEEDKTASRYIIREIDGSTYMFYEWKSGEYTFRGMKPKYYVLKKTTS